MGTAGTAKIADQKPTGIGVRARRHSTTTPWTLHEAPADTGLLPCWARVRSPRTWAHPRTGTGVREDAHGSMAGRPLGYAPAGARRGPGWPTARTKAGWGARAGSYPDRGELVLGKEPPGMGVPAGAHRVTGGPAPECGRARTGVGRPTRGQGARTHGSATTPESAHRKCSLGNARGLTWECRPARTGVSTRRPPAGKRPVRRYTQGESGRRGAP